MNTVREEFTSFDEYMAYVRNLAESLGLYLHRYETNASNFASRVRYAVDTVPDRSSSVAGSVLYYSGGWMTDRVKTTNNKASRALEHVEHFLLELLQEDVRKE